MDVMLCNPPFFASEEEMREGMEMKAGSAHAVGSSCLSCLAYLSSALSEMLVSFTMALFRCIFFSSSHPAVAVDD